MKYLKRLTIFIIIFLSACDIFHSNAGSSWDIILSIKFSSHEKNNYEFYVMNKDGSNLTRLTYTEKKMSILLNEYCVNCAYPSVSQDGRKIIFTRLNDGGGKYGAIIYSDGSNERHIDNTGTSVYYGTWMRNISNKVLVCKWMYGPFGNYELFVYDDMYFNNGSILFSRGLHQTYPSCHPDGNTILYNESNWKLRIYNISSGTDTPLVSPSNPIYNFGIFSPDGKYIVMQKNWMTQTITDTIVFTSNNIFVSPYPGPSITQLTFTGANRHPVWSPDGEKIYFMSARAPHASNYELYSMNRDGSNVKRITYFSDDDANAQVHTVCYRGVPR